MNGSKKKKKAVKVALATTMAASVVTTLPIGEIVKVEAAGEYSHLFAGGTGTQADPYLIATPQQLLNINQIITFTSGMYFKLTNDIDFAGQTIRPIGKTNSASFQGTFDGNNKTIKNYVMNETEHYIGLFYQLNYATVKNLTLENPQVTSTGDYTGALSSGVHGSTIENVHVKGGSIKGGFTVGGLIASSNASTIRKVSSSATVEGAYDRTGGLVGYANSTKLENVYTTGHVKGKNHVGGLFGYSSQSAIGYPSNISNSYSTAIVEGEEGVGGIVGLIVGSKDTINSINNVFALNKKVSGIKNVSLIGNKTGISNMIAITNAKALNTVDGNGSSLDITDVVEESKLSDFRTYANWDFATTWKIDPTTNLPVFQDQTALNGTKPTYRSTPLYEKNIVENKVYMLIRTKDELLNFIENDRLANYKLLNDIDFAGQTIRPIGKTNYAYFQGTFDGNNKTIKNYVVNETENNSGLFHKMSYATVKNLTLENPQVTSTGNFTGALSGEVHESTIENVHVKGGSIKGGSTVGGLIASSNASTIRKVSSSATVEGTVDRTGGLVGYADATKFENVYTTGHVKGKNNVGGLFGYSSYSAKGYPLNISNSYSTAIVEGEEGVGGIVGLINGRNGTNDTIHSINNVFALNKKVSGIKKVSLIANKTGSTNMIEITNAKALNTVDGNGSSLDITDVVEESKLSDFRTYANWDFATTWKIDPTTNLPVFQDQTALNGTKPTYRATPLYEKNIVDNKVYMLIRTKDELLNFIGNDLQANYKLLNDIDFAGQTIRPIGKTNSASFQGTFDGNNKTIKNYVMNETEHYIGLFYQLNYATVKNLTLENPQVTSTGDYTGALSGTVSGSTIENVHVKGGSIKGGSTVGGLIASSSATTIRKVSSSATVEGTVDKTGGLVGYANNTKFENVYTTGHVKGKKYVGGLFGYSSQSAKGYPSNISNSYSTAIVEGEEGVGGIVGLILGSNGTNDTIHSINNVFALNKKVSGIKNVSLIANKTGSTTMIEITNAKALNTVDGNGSSLDITDVVEESKLSDFRTYANWDFATTWKIDPTTNLPVFQDQTALNGTKPTYRATPLYEKNIVDNKVYMLIRTKDEFKNLLTVNKRDSFILLSDIDLAGENWTPIGTVNDPFYGTIEGNGKKISNLSITTSQPYASLLGYGNNATVKNLHLKNVNIFASGDYVGALFGQLAQGLIQDVSATGKLTSNHYTGGIVGTTNGTLERVYADVDINALNYVGGVVGHATGKLTDVYATGNIVANNYTGGVIGRYSASAQTIQNIYSSGNVDGADKVGGLIGSLEASNSVIKNSFALNTGIKATTTNKGKIYGYKSNGTSTNNFVREELAGVGSDPATSKSLNDLKKLATYTAAGWSTGIWGIEEGIGLPYLKAIGSWAWENGDVSGSDEVTVPDTPSTLESGEVTSSSVTISWDDVNADEYIIKRDGQEIARVQDNDSPTYSYTDTNPTPGTTHVYEVVPVNASGEGEGISIIVDVPSEPPAPIEEVEIGDVTSDQVTLTWNDVNADEYIIKRDGVELTRVSDNDSPMYSYTDTNPIPGATHSYTIIPVKDGVEGEGTVIVVEIPQPQANNQMPTAQNIPTQTIDRSVSSTKVLNLSQYFSDADGDTLSYTVTSDVSDTITGSLNGSTLTIEALKEGAATITVTADDGKGGQVTKSFVVVAIHSDNQQPEPEGQSITIYFPGVPNTKEYIIYRNGVEIDRIQDDGFTEYSYTDENVKYGEQYSYRVQVVPLDEEEPIDIDLGDIDLLPSMNVTVSVVDQTANIAWSEVQDAENYKVVVKDVAGQVVYTKEHGPTVQSDSIFLPKAGAYTVEVSVKANGEYFEPVVEAFTITENFTLETPQVEVDSVTPVGAILLWNMVPNSEGYVVKRNGVQVAVLNGQDQVVYEDSSVTQGSTYQYEVIAFKDDIESEAGTVSVTIPMENTAPTSKAIPAQNTVRSQNIAVDLSKYFTDADEGDTLSYTVNVGDNTIGSATLSGSTLTLTPKALGQTTVTVTASDEKGETTSQTFTFEVKNQVPTVQTIANVSMKDTDEARTIQLSDYFTDKDGEVLSFTFTKSGTSADVALSNGELTVTPKVEGETTITVTGTDPQGASVTTTFKVQVDLDVPATPQNVKATPSEGKVTLTWDRVEGASHYIVKRGGQELGTVTSPTYEDLTVQQGAIYLYEVIAVNSLNRQSAAARVQVNTLASAIQNLKAEVNGTTVNLSWDKFTMEGMDASKYRIVRYKKNAEGVFEAHTFPFSTSTNSYEFTGLDEGATYEFEVIPYHKSQYLNAYSSKVQASISKTSTDPGGDDNETPVDYTLTVTAKDSKTAELSWTAVQGAESYRIQAYQKNESGEWVTYQFPKTTSSTSYTFANLPEGKEVKFEVTPRIQYVYQVSLMMSETVQLPAGSGGDTGGGEEQQPPVQPALTITAKDTKTADLSWTAIEGATKYRVQAYTKDASGQWKSFSFARSVTGLEYTFTALPENAEVKFDVIPYLNNRYETTKAVSGTVQLGSTTGGGEQGEETLYSAPFYANVENGKITLFMKEESTITGYRVDRYVKNESGEFVKDGYTQAISVPIYSDSTVQEGKEYRYVITPKVGYVYKTDQAVTLDLPALVTIETPYVFFPLKPGSSQPAVYEVQRMVKDASGVFVKDGNVFEVTEGYFEDPTREEGKEYRYVIKEKLVK